MMPSGPDPDEVGGSSDITALADAIAATSSGRWSELREFTRRTRSRLGRHALLRAASTSDAYARSQAALLLATDPDASPGDLDHAFALLGDASDSHASVLPVAEMREAWTCLAQALLRAGRDHDVASILESIDLGAHHTWLLTTDLVNPARTGDRSAASVQRFLDAFNHIFVDDGLEPVTLSPHPGVEPDGNDFVSLRAVPAERIPGDDLITVVMSAFRPSHELRTAVRSICDQSWQAWELLIVDDDSGTEYRELLEEVAAGDNRIRLVHAPVNSGTYPARNLALTLASGRYVTFQDSDDWSHPRRLERQVRALQEHPRLLADRSWAIRSYSDLTLTYPGYPARRINASSLMLDRERTLDLVGDFDHIRVSADVELPKRMLAARPRSVLDRSRWGHLAITLLRQGSLSRADAVPGWTRWTRIAYRDAYEEWHGRIRTGRAAARYQHGDPRPFALPDARWLADRSSDPVPQPEIVVLGDLRSSHPRARATAELARVLAAACRVGLAHSETPHPIASRREEVHIGVQEQLNSGVVQHAHMSQRLHCALVVISEPSALLHAAELNISCDNVMLLADRWKDDPTWTVAAVSVEAARISASPPIWVLSTVEAQATFRAAHPKETIWPDSLGWVVDVDRLAVARSARSDGYLVVGNHLAVAEASDLPSQTEINSALPASRSLDVRLADATATIEALGRSTLPPGWVDLSKTGGSVVEFLGQLDAFVHLGAWSDDTEVGVLEALAADLPVALLTPTSSLPKDLAPVVLSFAAATLGRTLAEHDLPDPGSLGSTAVRARVRAWTRAVRQIIRAKSEQE